MAASHEVWARAAWAAVDMVELAGLPTASLFEGLPFDAGELRRLKRVNWDDYATLCERIGDLAGPGGLEDLLESTYHQVYPELRVLAGSVISPKTFFWFVIEVGTMVLFPPIACSVEDRGGDRVVVTYTLREGVRPCETWFRGTIGAVRGLPRHLGLPSAEVSAEVGPSHGIYDVRVPESRTLVHRAGRAVHMALRLVLGTEIDGKPFISTFGDVAEEPEQVRLADAMAHWKLTPRQSEVLRLVVRGNSNKEIAQALGCAESTVELHVTQLLRRSGASSRTQLAARFWSDANATEGRPAG